VFQDAHLLPWRTVLDNVALPWNSWMSSGKRAMRRHDALQQVNLYEAEDRYPAQLSGGHADASIAGAPLSHEAATAPARRPFAAWTRLRGFAWTFNCVTYGGRAGSRGLRDPLDIRSRIPGERAVVLTKRVVESSWIAARSSAGTQRRLATDPRWETR